MNAEEKWMWREPCQRILLVDGIGECGSLFTLLFGTKRRICSFEIGLHGRQLGGVERAGEDDNFTHSTLEETEQRLEFLQGRYSGISQRWSVG